MCVVLFLCGGTCGRRVVVKVVMVVGRLLVNKSSGSAILFQFNGKGVKKDDKKGMTTLYSSRELFEKDADKNLVVFKVFKQISNI